jgi:hypothetical protein
VSGGSDNRGYYFMRDSLNNYTTTIAQKKVIHYKSSAVPFASTRMPPF